MSGKIAVISEYNGGFVGTDDEILEWLECNSVSMGDCRFYEVGDELTVTGFTFTETT